MHRASQFGQDALIGDVLFKGRTGVFVDVGARDGIVNSNTYYLEQVCGWTGIAVEPHPDLFQMLKQTRNCACFNVALSDTEREGVAFVKYLEEPLGNSGIRATFIKPERFQKLKHEIISVPCVPMSKIVGDINLIHYLDIDVEGHELAVLRGIDFSRLQIRIIGVEVAEGHPDEVAIDELLADQGFRPFLQLVADRFYGYGPGIPSAELLRELP